jgi:hypothetical protein
VHFIFYGNHSKQRNDFFTDFGTFLLNDSYKLFDNNLRMDVILKRERWRTRSLAEVLTFTHILPVSSLGRSSPSTQHGRWFRRISETTARHQNLCLIV